MDPLADMRDIHLGAAIHQWPVAIGWWLVAIILLLCCVAIARLCYRQLKRRAVRKQLTAYILKIDSQALVKRN